MSARPAAVVFACLLFEATAKAAQSITGLNLISVYNRDYLGAIRPTAPALI